MILYQPCLFCLLLFYSFQGDQCYEHFSNGPETVSGFSGTPGEIVDYCYDPNCVDQPFTLPSKLFLGFHRPSSTSDAMVSIPLSIVFFPMENLDSLVIFFDLLISLIWLASLVIVVVVVNKTKRSPSFQFAREFAVGAKRSSSRWGRRPGWDGHTKLKRKSSPRPISLSSKPNSLMCRRHGYLLTIIILSTFDTICGFVGGNFAAGIMIERYFRPMDDLCLNFPNMKVASLNLFFFLVITLPLVTLADDASVEASPNVVAATITLAGVAVGLTNPEQTRIKSKAKMKKR